MTKIDKMAVSTSVREKRVYRRLRFPREMRATVPILVALSNNLTKLHEQSGLKKPDYAETLGISGAHFRMLRSCTANPKLPMLLEIANRVKIPLSALCGAPHVRGRLISGEEALEHFSLTVRAATKKMNLPELDKAKVLGISMLQLYRIYDDEASPPLLVCEAMAARLGMSLWELIGVDADRSLRRRS